MNKQFPFKLAATIITLVAATTAVWRTCADEEEDEPIKQVMSRMALRQGLKLSY